MRFQAVTAGANKYCAPGRSIVLWIAIAGIVGVVIVIACALVKSIFFQSIESGRVGAAKRMLACFPWLVRSEDEWRTTALDRAVELDQSGLVRALIEAGADVNHESLFIGMPLYHAAYVGNVPMAEILLNAGADPNRQASEHNTTCIGTALHGAALGGRLQTIRLLLNNRADVNARSANRGNYTPLMAAISTNPKSPHREKVVEELIEHGANVNSHNDLGESPLGMVRRMREVAFGADEIKTLESIERILLLHGAE